MEYGVKSSAFTPCREEEIKDQVEGRRALGGFVEGKGDLSVRTGGMGLS